MGSLVSRFGGMRSFLEARTWSTALYRLGRRGLSYCVRRVRYLTYYQGLVELLGCYHSERSW